MEPAALGGKAAQPQLNAVSPNDKNNRLVVFHEGAALNTYTYDSDGFKKVENVGGSHSTIIWDGTDYLLVRCPSSEKTFYTVKSQMTSYIESTLRNDFATVNLGSLIGRLATIQQCG